MRWVAIQRNPNSGAGRQVRQVRALMTGLRRHGIRPRLFSSREHLDEVVGDPMRRAGLSGIVAAGGDGTLLDVVTRHPGLPVAILPLGTENLVARYLGMPRGGAKVADVIADGHRCRFDIGCVGHQRFSVMVSVGFDASVIHRAHAQRTGHITRAGYLRPILQSIYHYRFPEIQVAIDGQPPVSGRLVVAANIPIYALGLHVVPTAVPDDGLLDVRVFRRGSVADTMRYMALCAWGGQERSADVVQLRGRHLRITSDEPAPVQIDGDPAGTTPIDVTIARQAGEFFVPAGRIPVTELDRKSLLATAPT